MFTEELTKGQAEEIKRLRARISELENDCKWMNMIYRSAWEICSVVGGEGEYKLNTEDKIFAQLWDRMQAYDDNQDLREKYEFVEKL
jgi:hypothetical protein